MSDERHADVEITPRLRIAAGELEWSFARSSGPGGQNVNKVNSKAVLRWRPRESPSLPADVRERFCVRYGSRLTEAGELILASEESRDQNQNVRRCLEKLRELVLSVATAPRRRRPTRPTKASQRRRVTAKLQHGQKKRERRPPSVNDR